MKYELDSNPILFEGRKLYQIKALKDIEGVVAAGDVGGFVEEERNLSQEGNCWITSYAKVYDKAVIKGDAIVSDHAQVYGMALVSGRAKVRGNSEVYQNAKIIGNGCVSAYAKVYGNAVISEHAKASSSSQIFDNAKLSGRARVTGRAKIFEWARVGESANVYMGAEVSGLAYIAGSSSIRENAKVSGDAFISGRAIVHGIVKETPIMIEGLGYRVLITENDMMIGCEHRSHEEWRAVDAVSAFDIDHENGEEFYLKWHDMLAKLCEEKGKGEGDGAD